MGYGVFISPWDVTWLLYIPTLYLLCIGSDGFQVLESFMGLSSLNGVVFGLVSNGIASFKPRSCLGVSLGILRRPLVCVSPGVFFLQTFANFL